jgi:uncharacterized membrane protein
MLDTLDDIRRYRDLIMANSVHGTAMPLGNETGITRAERDQLGAWLVKQ